MAGPGKKSLKVEAAEAKRRKEQREEELRAARLARAEAKRERHARLQQRLTREILYAGAGVSSQLTDLTTDRERLATFGLPVLVDAADVAELLGLEMKTLRWLTFHRDVAPVSHYRQFHIPKAKGGLRTIASPRPLLRKAQAGIRREILSRLDVTEQAQAFVKERSILTNAKPHVGKAVVVKVDITDFFGTITYPRVRGWFRKLGYSGMVSSLLALLTTEAKRVQAELDGKLFYVATAPRALPQGALTSPELTNQIARRIDARLSGYAKKAGWTYTRYADDLTFSHVNGARDRVGRLLGVTRAVLEDEGFEVNPDKVFVARKGRNQRVTGIVVNDQPGLDRRRLRQFRAAVHRVSKDGFQDDVEQARMLGFASYIKMVKPELGQRYLDTLKGISP